MKKYFTLIFIILFVPCLSFGATYYVSKIAGTFYYKSAAWPDTGGATACSVSDIEGCLADIGTGHTVVLDGGVSGTTYAAAELDSDGSILIPANTMTIRSPISTDPDLANHGGTVTLSGTGGGANTITMAAARSGLLFSNLTIANASGYGINFTGSGTIQDCIFNNSVVGGAYTNPGNTGKTVLMQRNTFLGTANVEFGVAGTTGTVNFYYNKFRPISITGGDAVYGTSGGIVILGIGTYNIYNNDFIGSGLAAIDVSGDPASGTVNIKNNIVAAAGNASGYAINLTAGQVTDVSNNYVLISPYANVVPITNADTLGNNIFSGGPPFVKPSRKGYLIFHVDNYTVGNDTWAYLYGSDGTDGLVAEFVKRGMKLTWFLDQLETSQQTNYEANMLWFKNQGMEIGNHTYSHFNMTFTNAFTVTTTGAGTPTIDVDRTTHKIILTSGDVGSPWSVPAVGNFETTALSTLVAEIEALAFFGCTISSATMVDALGEILQDTAGPQTFTANSYTVTIDKTTGASPATGLFKAEVLDPLNWLESILGVGYIKSFTYPAGANDATAREGVRLINSGQMQGSKQHGLTAISNMISNLDRYKFSALDGDDVKADINAGNETEDIKARISGLCAWAAEMGGVFGIISHKATDLTKAQWIIILDEALKWQGQVSVKKSTTEAFTEIIAESSDDLDGTITRAWTDESDYHLQSSSPATNAGTNVGLTSDYEGDAVPIGLAPDIGAYEYKPGGFIPIFRPRRRGDNYDNSPMQQIWKETYAHCK